MRQETGENLRNHEGTATAAAALPDLERYIVLPFQVFWQPNTFFLSFSSLISWLLYT